MKKHLLVVDDELNIRNVCKDILEDEGYRVSMAADGFEALEKMDTEYYELFIIDMIMPGMDGLQLLKKIKKRQPLAVVIITTGFSSIEGAVKAVHAGAFQYLSKPLNADELVDTVEKGLSHSERLYGPLQNAFKSSAPEEIEQLKGSVNIVFEGIDQTDKKELFRIGQVIKFNQGDDITTNDRIIDRFFMIKSGEVSVWADDVSIDYIRKGDCWGEEEFLLKDAGFTKLRAESSVEILGFENNDLIAFLDKKGDFFKNKFYQNLTNSLYYKWRKSVQRIVMLKMVSS